MRLPADPAFAKRFWAKVDKRNGPIVRPELGRCWPFTGATKRCGRKGQSRHGNMAVPLGDGKRTFLGAHRVALGLEEGGEIPEGMDGCHACDNPLCCRPSHLSWGTHQDNIADYIAKFGPPGRPKQRPDRPLDGLLGVA